MNYDEVIIDEEFKALIKPLSSEEKEQLTKNIIRYGCQDALKVWAGENILLDGHNRYEICKKNEKEFDIKRIEFDSREAAKIWIIQNQFGRRNLLPYDRALLAIELEPLYAERARQRQIEAGKSNLKQGDKLPVNQNSGELEDIKIDPHEKSTMGQLAKEADVSRDTIAKVKVIKEKASEEQKELLQTGEASIHAIYKELATTSGQADYDGDEWYTPLKYIEASRAVMGSIDLDPCSCELAQKTVNAKKIYTKEDDSLTKEWKGNVFINPPYSDVKPFSDKFINSNKMSSGIMLVNNCTDAEWFHSLVDGCDSMCITRGRISFEHPNRQNFATRQGQFFFYKGDDPEKFKQVFSQFGKILIESK